MRAGKQPAATVAVLMLFLAAILYLTWPLWRAQFAIEIDGNEAWNAYLADAAWSSRPLYPPPAELTGNNYPPLSFYLIGGLQLIGGDAVYIGRALSILATLGIGFAVFVLVRLFAGGWIGGAVAGLWFVATMARFYSVYVGMNDPHLLGLAIMAAAFVWFWVRWRAGRAVEPAIVLMVVAGFVKHSLIVIPATALIFLLLEDWRRGLRATLVGAATAGAGLLLCFLAYGTDFFADLMAPRVLSISESLYAIERLRWIVALAFGAAWAWLDRSSIAAKIFAIFAVVGILSYFLQKLGIGVDDNAAFELTIAAAFGFGMAFARLPQVWPYRRVSAESMRWVMLAIVLLRLLLSPHMEPYLVPLSASYRATVAAHSDIADAETKRIAALSGKVYCTYGTVCRRAGKAYVVDDFKQKMLIATGATSQADLDERLRREGIRQEDVDWRVSIYSIDTDPPTPAPR